MVRAFLALGSNLGDRQAYLDRAILRLRALPGLTICRVSQYYETAPVGGPPDAGHYLNAVAEAETCLSPEQLLSSLLEIEQSFGRVRSERNSPRTLDLDLLTYGDLVRDVDDPIVPHTRMHERRFVLQPLADLAPDFVHGRLGRTISALLAALPNEPNLPKAFPRITKVQSPELTGIRSLVTGSTRGIGRAIALEFAQHGAHVLVHGCHSLDRGRSVVKEIEALGVQSGLLMANVADPSECERLVQDAWSKWSGFDVFVQCAGADLLTGEAASWTFERKWQTLSAIDVLGTMRLCRNVGHRMNAANGGVILTVGWDQAETGFGGESGELFGAAKGAVMCFTRSLARTLAPNVRVNCLAPGWIKTAWGEQASESWQRRVESETLLRRWGLPEDVAATARWLVSPTTSFVTGQTVRINGGLV